MLQKLNTSALRKINIRELLASVLLLISLSSLFMGQLAFAAMWIYAWQRGIFPNGPFDDGRGGPWSNIKMLDHLYSVAHPCFFLSFFASGASLPLRVCERAVVLFGISAASLLFFGIVCLSLMLD